MHKIKYLLLLTAVAGTTLPALAENGAVGLDPYYDQQGRSKSMENKSQGVYPIFKATTGRQDSGSSYPNNQQNFVFYIPSIRIGGGYNVGNGVFTAPLSGYYSFSYDVSAGGNSSPLCDIGFALNGIANENITSFATNTHADWSHWSQSTIFKLKVGDRISVMRISCNNDKPTMWRGNFSGFYIHP